MESLYDSIGKKWILLQGEILGSVLPLSLTLEYEIQ